MAPTCISVLTLIIGVTLLLIISGTHSLNVLTSHPSQINGTLVACVGDEISLTCSHDNVVSVSTQWIISSPVNCSTHIVHNPPTPIAPPCGPFSFQNITLAEQGVTQLNSTVVAIVNSITAISGSKVECKAGFITLVSIGNISICVIDELPEPGNPWCMELSRGLLVTWNVVTDGFCARSFITHEIKVIREADGTVITSMNDVMDTQIEITNSLLEPSQNYSIHVRTNLVQGTCASGEPVTIVCRTSEDFSPTTVLPAPDPGSSYDPTVTAVVVVVIVVIITMTIVIALVVVLLMIYRRHEHNESGANTGGPQVQHPQNSDPLNTEIPDTEADLELATHRNIAYLDINSTRSQKVNRTAGVSVSMAMSALGTTNEGQLYTEIHELGDESSTEIPVSQNVAYVDLKHVN